MFKAIMKSNDYKSIKVSKYIEEPNTKLNKQINQMDQKNCLLPLHLLFHRLEGVLFCVSVFLDRAAEWHQTFHCFVWLVINKSGYFESWPFKCVNFSYNRLVTSCCSK